MKFKQLTEEQKIVIRDFNDIFKVYLYGFLNQFDRYICSETAASEEEVVEECVDVLKEVFKNLWEFQPVKDRDSLLKTFNELSQYTPTEVSDCKIPLNKEYRYYGRATTYSLLTSYYNPEGEDYLYHLMLLGKKDFYEKVLNIDSNFTVFGAPNNPDFDISPNFLEVLERLEKLAKIA